MSSPRFTSSPSKSKARGDPNPPPPGQGDCNTKYALNMYSFHNLSTVRRRPVDKYPESVHSAQHLSTVSVDKSRNLWISAAVDKSFRLIVTTNRGATCG